MDIKHALSMNPLRPAYRAALGKMQALQAMGWREFEGGLVETGHDGQGFAFDNEGPRHRSWLDAFALAIRPSNCGEYLEFIEDGGYRRPEFWLSAGWDCVNQRGWDAPLYWEKKDGIWHVFTLSGLEPVDPARPVCHVSAFEAAAFAKWSGKRLPREAEWEIAAGAVQGIGEVWEWTASPYVAYPGYREPRRRHRRIQRQVHGEPDGAARRMRRDACGPCTSDLSQLLSARRTLDVRRNPSRGGSPMNVPLLAIDDADVADRDDFRRAVLSGLGRSPRAIPAKFLYDARGSALFDAICELPEYYPTRTETAILRDCAADIARLAGPGCALVEYGSGSSVKTRLLLDAMPDLHAYVPIDISRQHLDATATAPARGLSGAARRSGLRRLHGDRRACRPAINGARRIGFFPGSTIGNLTPEEAKLFLRRARRLLRSDGALILGVDLKKDPQRLHDAYNDAAGVTAQFTLNLLRRMNRELEANFDLSAFAHEAFYNEPAGRIEIYFRSLRDQTVTIAGRRFAFAGRRARSTPNIPTSTTRPALPSWRAWAASRSPEPGPIRPGCLPWPS